MSQQVGKSLLQKKQTHYLNSILITSLALLLLGIMSLLFISFKYEETRIKEKFMISAILKDEIKEADVDKLVKKIESNDAVKSTLFISKADALKKYQEDFNEDPSEILGDINPLPPSIEIYLKADHVNVDSMRLYMEELQKYPEITLTRANEELIGAVDDDLKIAGFVIAGLSILFLLVSIAIIDKTIRISMYSNRFIIRSMQLVGATRNFITGPYVRRSVVNGITSAAIAILLLIILAIFVQRNYNYWDFSSGTVKAGFAMTFIMLVAVGILITWFSTRSSVHKYVKMKLDELY